MKTNVPSEPILRNLLLGCGIPLEKWGKEGAKPVSELQDEHNNGESYLRIDQNGLARVVRIVKANISDPAHPERGFLLMLKQELPGGIVRERTKKNNHPSEKIMGEETMEAALARGLEEELQLSIGDWKITGLRVREESNLSPTFPDLPTVYQITDCDVSVNPDCHVASQDEFSITTADPKEGTLHFAWEHPRQRKK